MPMNLPRYEARFKELLNVNTINEIANFHAQLSREREEIRDRITLINQSLTQIDYNPGRYIVLESQPTPDADIRDFQSELRACTEGAMSGSDDAQYSEAKFLQVKHIIDRFRGRDGQTELDRRWTAKVTDVRNWFMFAASERWREDKRRARALFRLRRQIRRPEGEAGLHHSRGQPGLPVRPGMGRGALAPSALSSSTRPSAAAPTNRRNTA
jgi:uncharacterized protein YPO0396